MFESYDPFLIGIIVNAIIAVILERILGSTFIFYSAEINFLNLKYSMLFSPIGAIVYLFLKYM